MSEVVVIGGGLAGAEAAWQAAQAGVRVRLYERGRDAVIAWPIDERSTSGATTRTLPNSEATAASTAIPGL